MDGDNNNNTDGWELFTNLLASVDVDRIERIAGGGGDAETPTQEFLGPHTPTQVIDLHSTLN